jgi:hypothetical protein
MQSLTEEIWLSIYRPLPNHRIAHQTAPIWATDYEFDPHHPADVALVRACHPRRVWTIVEGDDGGSEFIIEGAHLVNRRAYIVTIGRWKPGVTFAIPFFPTDDGDQIGEVQP